MPERRPSPALGAGNRLRGLGSRQLLDLGVDPPEGGTTVARAHRTRPTLTGTFEAREQGPPARLVVTLEDHGVLHGHMAFGTLRLWLRGAHTNRGRLGVGALSTTSDGSPLAWVRLLAVEDAVRLDLDPVDGPERAPMDRSSVVVFGRLEEEA